MSFKQQQQQQQLQQQQQQQLLNNWKKELNELSSIPTPETVAQNIIYNENIKRRNELNELIEKYEDNQLRELLVFEGRTNTGQRAFHRPHPGLPENVDADDYDLNHRPSSKAKPSYASLSLSSPRRGRDRSPPYDAISLYSPRERDRPPSASLSLSSPRRRRDRSPPSASLSSRRGGAGKVKVYTGPKNGKYIIKNGSKVYIDRKSISNNVQYIKKTKPKKK